MPFLTRYGMDEAERRRRKAFLGITEADAENVRKLRDAFAEHARGFAERFYEHLLADPHTRAYLRDPEQLRRLKGLQAEYFAQLLDGVFDVPYFEGRLRVGVTHQRIGLSPVWYLGAYNQYIQLTFPMFVRAFGDDLEKVLPLLLSLVKVIFLDVGLALDTYFQEATAQLRQRNEELQQALGLYWQGNGARNNCTRWPATRSAAAWRPSSPAWKISGLGAPKHGCGRRRATHESDAALLEAVGVAG